MTAGTEWLIEASGCDAEGLRDVELLRRLFQRVVADLELCIVGEPVWHRFPGAGGVTGFALLSESHLACHTYPEYGLITLNLYCCRARPEWPWEESLHTILGATEVRVRAIDRSLLNQESLSDPKHAAAAS